MGEVCRGNRTDPGAYFLQGKRVMVLCPNPPKFRVFVNPPKEDNDGTVLLCGLCNRFEYATYRREPFTPTEGSGL